MSSKKSLLLFLVVAFVVAIGSIGMFYGGRYQPPPLSIPDLQSLTRPVYQAKGFSDLPLVRKGLLVIDNAHWNSYQDEELSVLIERITARGFTVVSTGLTSESEDKVAELEEKLRGALAYAVILPWNRFSEREVGLVKNFVNKGGRLLLVGDATRSHRLNTLAQTFGINFEDDYLYNIKEHEATFQSIFLKDFQSDELTKGLQEIVLYTASSITSEGKGLVFTDENTFSSKRERTGKFLAAVRAYDNKVVAISDFTFMIPPYNSIHDNDQLVSNIADFLTQGERDYELADFPYFLGQEAPLVVLNDELLPVAQTLRAALSTGERTMKIRDREDLSRDNIVLGLWEDSAAVEYYLSSGGISAGAVLRTPVSPEISKKGIALLYLHKGYGRRVLVILGDSKETLETAISQLESGKFRKSLVSENIAIIFAAGTRSQR